MVVHELWRHALLLHQSCQQSSRGHGFLQFPHNLIQAVLIGQQPRTESLVVDAHRKFIKAPFGGVTKV